MVVYTVTWTDAADDDLMDTWLRATDRRAVTAASHRVGPELRVDADGKGVDFYGDRLMVIPPLTVVFRVSIDDRLVTVLQVW